MHKRLMGLLGAIGFLAACAVPASAQEEGKTERVWKSDGKRYSWVEVKVAPVEVPGTLLVEVPRGQQKEGDLYGTKLVGKNTEFVYYRRLPIPEPTVVKGHRCSMRTARVRKNTEFQHFCIVDGVEMPCPGMNEKGECLATK